MRALVLRRLALKDRERSVRAADQLSLARNFLLLDDETLLLELLDLREARPKTLPASSWQASGE